MSVHSNGDQGQSGHMHGAILRKATDVAHRPAKNPSAVDKPHLQYRSERIDTTCIASFAIILQTKTVSSDITSLTTEDQTIGRVFTPTVCVSSKPKEL
ncbi:hypothetical protein AALO_G00029300 [Alosa alosa]|uniref:Uncharacterized protein n=1 Tax=Alosa alosa TaxID=278164 RepID=A0AAV6HC13_9TELE|nr:hypothetical protein AALO_G00029300 [Alosa alosa]